MDQSETFIHRGIQNALGHDLQYSNYAKDCLIGEQGFAIIKNSVDTKLCEKVDMMLNEDFFN